MLQEVKHRTSDPLCGSVQIVVTPIILIYPWLCFLITRMDNGNVSYANINVGMQK